AMDYMKGDMEKLYGGTVGDRGLVYLEELEKAKRERGECPLGGPLYWVPLAYLHHIGTEIAFSHMGRIFEDWCGWERNVLQVGLVLHVRTMGLRVEEYEEKGYWCAFDRGDRTGPFPDILYTKPLIVYTKGKEGRTVARMSTDEWDEESRTPVEVEITPSKNPE